MATKIVLIGWPLYGLVNQVLTISFVSPYRQHFISTFIVSWLKPLLTRFGMQRWMPFDSTASVNVSIQMVSTVA